MANENSPGQSPMRFSRSPGQQELVFEEVNNRPPELLPENSSSSSTPRVLLVEDSLVLQAIVFKQLTRFGVSVTVVSDGTQAIDAIMSANYDIILMDCMLPKMDGFQATRIIREREGRLNRHTPIIAMTACGDPERCFAAGMDDYVEKPVACEFLRGKIKQWLNFSA